MAPFHQWTPDVYEGAPTPITAFMAVATKAAAFGVLLRLFDVALIGAQADWAPALAALAAITIVVGNVGALGQSSLKRMLAYSSVAQAGYMLAGVVVSTQLGVQATVFYLAVYLVMNIAAFAVIVARERETGLGDDIASLAGLGATRPWLAWPMTIAMLALAGIPATARLLRQDLPDRRGRRRRLHVAGVVIVVGSMISLAYYLRVVAAVWMRPAAGTELTPCVARPRRAPGAGRRRGSCDGHAARSEPEVRVRRGGLRRAHARGRHRALAAVRLRPARGPRAHRALLSVAFDLDGVLVDSRRAFANCVNHALASVGVAARPEAELHPFLGPPLHATFAQLAGEADADACVAAYRSRYLSHGFAETSVIEGMDDALDVAREELRSS